jgi:hypothetical protein
VPAAAAREPSEPEFFPARRLPRGTWLGVLVVGAGLFELLQQALIATKNPNLVPSLILVGSVAIPGAFVAFIYSRRPPYDVPGGVLAVVALTGGVIGPTRIRTVTQFARVRTTPSELSVPRPERRP